MTYDTGYVLVPIDRKYRTSTCKSQASAATSWLEERYGLNFQVTYVVTELWKTGEISVA